MQHGEEEGCAELRIAAVIPLNRKTLDQLQFPDRQAILES
jgi:hypothetical protein